jgi:hypothetical protein
MKKSTTRSLLFIVLLAASIGAYAFLNVASYNLTGSTTAEQQEEQLHESEEVKLVLPDVRLIKKVVEHGQRLLPAS